VLDRGTLRGDGARRPGGTSLSGHPGAEKLPIGAARKS
jgi:hypothetical protein